MVMGTAACLGIRGLSIKICFRHTVNGVPCRTTHVYALKGDDLATRSVHMYRPMDIKFFGGSQTEISKPHFLPDGLQFIPWEQLATTMYTTILCGNFSDRLLTEQPLTFTLICRRSRTCQRIVLPHAFAWPNVCLEFLLDLDVSLLMVMQANPLNCHIPQWPPSQRETMSWIHFGMFE